jgi:hypothetical protein
MSETNNRENSEIRTREEYFIYMLGVNYDTATKSKEIASKRRLSNMHWILENLR